MIRRQKTDLRPLHIFSLTSIGIAHPLQEQLSRNPEFFVVKHSGVFDILALTLFLSLLTPLALIAIIKAFRILGERAHRNAYYLVFFLLVLIAASTALNRIAYAPIFVHFLISAALSFLVVYGYAQYESIRSTFPYLGVAIVLAPVLFLAHPSIRKLLFPPEYVQQSTSKISQAPPIVMVIWDELPLVSLLDANNQIDQRLYPNLSSFSKESYWFRNASTVSPATHAAVSAILSGTYPKPEALAYYYDYPRNLFTLLHGNYELNVRERETRLCPMEVCDTSWIRPEYTERMRLTLKDVSAISLNILMPLRLSDHLPTITENWGDFWNERGDPAKEFESFLNSITPGGRPALHFIHSNLPHSPWSYTPSPETQAYILKAVMDARNQRSVHVPEEFPAHLMQVSYVDGLVGRLVQKLRHVGLYDQTLIIITSDHGIALNGPRPDRTISQRTYRDIMLVPLFIKIPHQVAGEVVDRNVEAVDILPTIAQLLNVETTWVDGTSVLDFTRSERTRKIVYSDGVTSFEPEFDLSNTLKKAVLP